jgi:heme exporter protein D
VTEFFAMGGEAPYVWTAYGITLAAIVLNAWAARRKLARALDETRRAARSAEPARRPKVRQLQ